MKRAALYLRVSTREQTIENQLPDVEALGRLYGLTVVARYEEQESAVRERPRLAELLRDAKNREFEAVLVWAIDRLGRNMHDIVCHVLELERGGVEVLSAREPWLNIPGPARQLLISVFGWVAELERARLVERTHAGLARARAQGKRLGRPPVAYVRAELAQLVAGRATVDTIARRLHVSRATAGRLKKGAAVSPQ